MDIPLTQPNLDALKSYADLVGVSHEEFLNRFLEEFLVARFADRWSGNAEPFLCGFRFSDREKAERLADWVKERLTIPGSRNSLELEVVQLPGGGYKVQAALVGDGSMYRLSD